MTTNEKEKLEEKIKLYRIGVVILVIIIFFLVESWAGTQNKYNDLYDTIDDLKEESYEQGYDEGYQDGVNE